MMKRLFSKKFIFPFLRDIFSIFGFFEILLTILGAFDVLKVLSDSLRASSGVLIIFSVGAVLISGWINWPKSVFEYQLSNRDSRIKFVIGNLFDQSGSLVIPINSDFDASLGGSVERSNSIKAQVLRRFFGDDKVDLQDKLNKRLSDPIYVNAKKGGSYEIGTTVTVMQNGQRFYFVANSIKINSERIVAHDDDLVPTLSGLWSHLSTHGAKGDVVIPLLGTGNGRMTLKRGDVFKEIVRSFVASCADKCHSECLTIVIRPEDVANHSIEVDDLDQFLKFNCRYAAAFQIQQGQPTGTPVATTLTPTTGDIKPTT